ncbi:MAG: PH domain-containing protein [Chloroflexi bacterium]|nr:PH domain-containing protein [Chloroflexota bacterium]MCL5025806.1 PH domain-containing protein [Chloroflexota bacterium]
MAYLDKLLGEGERPVFATQQHWIAFLGRNLSLVLLLIAAIAAAVAFDVYAVPQVAGLSSEQQWIVRVIAVIVLVLYPAVRFLLHYYQWRAEQYVITNLRVIQLSGIFEKNVIDSSLEKVNDVMMHQSLIGRWLNYGDVEILTASEIGVNRFVRVARPLAFKTAMLNAKQELERGLPGAPARGASQTAVEVPDLIARYAALRDQGILTEEEFQAKKKDLLAQR